MRRASLEARYLGVLGVVRWRWIVQLGLINGMVMARRGARERGLGRYVGVCSRMARWGAAGWRWRRSFVATVCRVRGVDRRCCSMYLTYERAVVWMAHAGHVEPIPRGRSDWERIAHLWWVHKWEGGRGSSWVEGSGGVRSI
jgi:hypothetical protein